MTIALCLNCGDTIIGAFNSCDKCGFESDSDEFREVSVLFSEWQLSGKQYHYFSSIIQKIYANNPDKDISYWIFLRFVSVNHPLFLHVDLAEHIEAKADEILHSLDIEIKDLD
jgi:hypothetical protein